MTFKLAFHAPNISSQVSLLLTLRDLELSRTPYFDVYPIPIADDHRILFRSIARDRSLPFTRSIQRRTFPSVSRT